jgi:phosphate-selective porin OprO/OprP
MPDFAGTPTLYDAYANVHLFNEIQLQAGKLKPPVGLDRLRADKDRTFVESGLPTNLVPNRDVGVQLHGEILDGTISYAGGVFNGAADGAMDDTDNNDKKDWIGRVFVRPFVPTSATTLRGLGLGVAASRGTQTGVLPTYKSPGQNTVFQYAASAVGSGTHRRLAPQGYFYVGPFGVLGEWVRSSQVVANGTSTDRVDVQSWHIEGSFVVTGENASYGTVSPAHPLDPARGTIGALELDARYGELKVGDDAFSLKYADLAKSVSAEKAWAVGINWYFARNVKAMATYERTKFTGGSASGDRDPEVIVFSRLQVAY